MKNMLEQIIEELSVYAKKVDYKDIEKISKEIMDAQHVFISGVGRSGFVANAFANRLMHLEIPVYVVGLPTTPAIQPMGNTFEQLSWLMCDSVIAELMNSLNKKADEMFNLHANLE